MSSPVTVETLYISKTDAVRLERLIASARARGDRDLSYLGPLKARLDHAKSVLPREVPSYVVTMNTRVQLLDVATGVPLVFTLVFPEEADPSKDKISVLAPLGAALLGACQGDVIRWKTPGGVRETKIEAILYQPEAAGRYDL